VLASLHSDWRSLRVSRTLGPNPESAVAMNKKGYSNDSQKACCDAPHRFNSGSVCGAVILQSSSAAASPTNATGALNTWSQAPINPAFTKYLKNQAAGNATTTVSGHEESIVPSTINFSTLTGQGVRAAAAPSLGIQRLTICVVSAKSAPWRIKALHLRAGRLPRTARSSHIYSLERRLASQRIT